MFFIIMILLCPMLFRFNRHVVIFPVSLILSAILIAEIDKLITFVFDFKTFLVHWVYT